jgi:DNA repair exonuclease SbcCD nuclease subunit
MKIFRVIALVATMQLATVDAAEHENAAWTFVSIPDFLNVDTTYPQPGWEDALDYVLKAVKAENPDFVLVAGDLVMGRWWSEEKIEKYAAIYYPQWIDRMNAHGLKFYTAIGDHEIGDNPWPPRRAKLVPVFKKAFRDHLKMPLNGPEDFLGTAFFVEHKNTLIVAVDVFEYGKGSQGEIVAQVTGKQLEWLNRVIADHAQADHIVVMGHTPILGPVRKQSSSGLMLENGRESVLWQTMARHQVDLYLCGEVHAITCTERDGVQQVAHGGLFGYNPKVNYLVGHVSRYRIDLELKELDIHCDGARLWQEGDNRPYERVTISSAVRTRGFVDVGKLTINKSGDKKQTHNRSGYFDESRNPKN